MLTLDAIDVALTVNVIKGDAIVEFLFLLIAKMAQTVPFTR